jgi:hypothetical protein
VGIVLIRGVLVCARGRTVSDTQILWQAPPDQRVHWTHSQFVLWNLYQKSPHLRSIPRQIIKERDGSRAMSTGHPSQLHQFQSCGYSKMSCCTHIFRWSVSGVDYFRLIHLRTEQSASIGEVDGSGEEFDSHTRWMPGKCGCVGSGSRILKAPFVCSF